MAVMRRAVPTIPVTPGMLRHFAVLTVAITGCIAMFADGENRQFVADQLKMRQAKNQALHADAEKGGKSRTIGGLKIAKGARIGNSGDSAPNFSSAPDSGGTIDPSGRFSQMSPPPSGPAYGPSPANAGQPYIAMGDPALAGTTGPHSRKPRPQPPRPPSQAEIDAMVAASRARSAGDGSSQASDPEE